MSNSKKEATNKPVSRFTLKGITASVFRNETDKGIPFYKVSITRTFKDGDDYRTTTAFGRDDLPYVREASRHAWLDVIKREADESSSKSDDDE